MTPGPVPASMLCEVARSLLLRQRVQVAHQAFEPLLQDMRVDLRGRYVGVAEQRLHDAQVGAVLQQVTGEGVAQDVRADLRGFQSGGCGSAFNSRAKCCRLRCPLSPNEGNSHLDLSGFGDPDLASARSAR